MIRTFELTKVFTAGVLAGLTHTAITTVYVAPGTEVKNPFGGSSYKVVSCVQVKN